MAEESTGIKYSASIDDERLKQDAERIKKELRDISDTAVSEGNRIDRTFKKIGASVAAVFTVQAAMNFARQIVAVRQEVESLEISFRTLLGNEEKANRLLGELREYAVKTPLQLNDLARGAQTLLSFNVEAEKVMPTLKAIGDISMGDAQKLQSLTLAFAQISSNGKLMGQDLLQLINAGFNPLTVIAEKTGKSIAELKDEMSKGAITAEMVSDAFMDATSEGGKFYGMLEKQSKSLGGSFSNLQGAINDMMNELGEKIQGPLSSTLNVMMKVVQNYEKLGKVAADIIVTFGAYKAAVMAVTAVENIRYQATLAHMAGLTKMQAVTTILKEKTAALNKTMLANPYVAAATAIAALAVAMWRLSRNETEAARAQKEFNKELEKHKAVVETSVSKYDFFISKLNAAKRGTDEYRVAVKNITDEYGEYLNKLGIEADKLKDLKDKQSQLRDEIIKTSKIKAKSALLTFSEDQYNETISNARAIVQKQLSKIYKEGSAEFVNGYNNVLQKISKGEHIYTGGWTEADYEKLFPKGDFAIGAYDSLIKAMNSIIDAGKIYQQQVNSILTVMDASEEQVTDRLTQLKRAFAAAETKDDKERIRKEIQAEEARQQQVTKNKKYWEEQVKTLMAQREALENNAENQTVIKDLEAKILKAQAEVDKYNPKSLSRTSDKLENDAARQRKQQEQLKRIKEDYDKKLAEDEINAAREKEQASINVMEEGTEKKLAQIELDYNRQNDLIRRKERDMLNDLIAIKEEEWEAENPDKVKRGEMFDRGTVTKDMLSDTQKAQIQAMKDAAEEAREYAKRVANEEKNALLSDYMDLQTQIENIRKRYDKLRKEAGNDTTVTDNINKAQRREIAALVMDTFKAEEGVGRLAGQIDSLGKSARGAVIDKLQKILQFAQGNKGIVSKDDIYAFAELNGISGQLLESLMTNDEALEQFAQHLKDIGDKEPITSLTDAVKRYRKALEEAKSGKILDTDALEKAKEMMNAMVKELADNVLDELSSIGNALSQIGEMVGNKDLQLAGEALDDVVSNIKAAEQGAEAWGGWWGAIIGGLTDLLPKIVKWVNKGTERSLEDTEKMLADTEKMLSYWKEIYKNSNWTANDYTQAYDSEEVQALIDKIKDARRYINANIAALAGTVLSGNVLALQDVQAKIEEIKKGSKDITEYVGQIMDEIAEGVSVTAEDAYGKMMDAYDSKLDELQAKLEKLLRYPKKNKDEIENTLIEIAEVAQEKLDEILAHAESIVGVTSDQLFSDMYGMISAAFDAGKDSVDDFDAYYNRMVRNMIKTNVMKQVLESLLSKDIELMANSITSYQRGEITQEDLIMQLQAIGEGMQNVANNTLDTMRGVWQNVLDLFPDMDEVTAESRGVAAASQDSIDELNGRMTVIQAHTTELVASSALNAANTGGILAVVEAIKGDTASMRKSLNRIEAAVAGSGQDTYSAAV